MHAPIWVNCGAYAQPVPPRTDPEILMAGFRADPEGAGLRTPSGRIEIFSGTIALAAGLAVAASTTASAAPAAPAAVPSFAGPPAATICTPSWGSIVLPFCV